MTSNNTRAVSGIYRSLTSIIYENIHVRGRMRHPTMGGDTEVKTVRQRVIGRTER